MWFDVQQALTEIEGGTPPPLVPAQDSAQRLRVAIVANVATLPVSKHTMDAVDHHTHGTAFDERPLLGIGRVVSLAAWRMLTEWERHGPSGQHWSGVCRCWHNLDQCREGEG